MTEKQLKKKAHKILLKFRNDLMSLGIDLSEAGASLFTSPNNDDKTLFIDLIAHNKFDVAVWVDDNGNIVNSMFRLAEGSHA